MSRFFTKKPVTSSLLVTLTLAVVIAASAYYRYHERYNAQRSLIDTQLLSSVQLVNHLVAKELHQQPLLPNTISYQAEMQLAQKLTQISQTSKLTYIYSLIQDKDGAIRFTSSSKAPEEIENNTYEAAYWTLYQEAPAELRAVFRNNKADFSEYKDRWGTHRSAFIPFTNSAGNTYVIGADFALNDLEKIAQRLLAQELILLAIVIGLLTAWSFIYIHQIRKTNAVNQKFESALSAAQIVAWEWDVDKNTYQLTGIENGAFGYTQEELPKTPDELLNIIHPEDVELFKTALEIDAQPGKASTRAQIRMRNKEGHYLWIRTKGKTLQQNHKIIRTGILENIDAFTHMQLDLNSSRKQLTENQHFLSALLNTTTDMVSLKNEHGTYLNCNSAFETMFGVKKNQIIGKSDENFVPKDIAEQLKNNDLKALHSKHPIRVSEWLAFAKEDKPRLIETLKTQVLDAKGNISGALSVGRDITEWQETVNNLRKFKRFAEQSEQGLAIAKISGELDYINPYLKKLIPSLSDQLAENISELYPVSLHKKIADEILPTTLEKGIWTGELLVEVSSQTHIPTLCSFFAIRNKQDVPVFIGNIIQDISDQKEFETELEMAKEVAEQASRSKSAFLANMSHEIRTPLNAILGYSQLLVQENIDDSIKTQIKQIFNSGQRLLQLINEILDLSKIEAGHMSVQRARFDLNSELFDVTHLLKASAQSKGLRLQLDNQLPNNAFVWSDKQKIGQILLNLLTNAIKFTSAGQVILSARQHKQGVMFTITDTGTGISEDDLKRLFQPFTQGQAGTTQGQGTGLGLALSRRLTELLGGTLNIEKSSDSGTTVNIDLPLNISQDQPEVHHALNTDSRTTLKIPAHQSLTALVVDDDDDSRNILTRYLRNVGLTVQEFSNGASTYHYLKQNSAEIVFTDIRMPHTSGEQLLGKIRGLPQHSQMPVVAVSASTMDQERSYFLSNGFDAFIGKPVQFPEIDQSLRQLLKLPLTGAGEDAQAHTVFLAPTPEDTPPLAAPQRALLTQLRHAAMAGEVTQVAELIAQLSSKHIGQNRYRELLSAQEHYNFETIETLIDEWLTPE
ncbi:ATP-binding protein [Teredinibacter haidensis]|uniref:ATP-binding protein n=1 Tax=Teredinibacter haidensis TaxID=2731755 RepID=UPI0009488B73|nr:ATP-binding protein [Teredinibacter haidensis]